MVRGESLGNKLKGLMQFLEIGMEGSEIGLFGSKTVSKLNKRN